jgi:two-component system sensor histidine kinase/response regulator
MGGSIGVESEPGGGSRFWFTADLAIGTPADLTALSVQNASRSGPFKKDRQPLGRVLLAEDNKIKPKIAAHLLKGLGYTADVAANGLEALNMLGGSSCDLVLMDCQMPEMDGFEAVDAIRRRSDPLARIPVIALTANAMSGDRGKCPAAGMNDYLPKPITKDSLRAVLDRWHTARSSHQEGIFSEARP